MELYTVTTHTALSFLGCMETILAKSFRKYLRPWHLIPSETVLHRILSGSSFLNMLLGPHGSQQCVVLKTHLKWIAGDKNLTTEEFSTVLTQIEVCLNFRFFHWSSDLKKLRKFLRSLDPLSPLVVGIPKCLKQGPR